LEDSFESAAAGGAGSVISNLAAIGPKKRWKDFWDLLHSWGMYGKAIGIPTEVSTNAAVIISFNCEIICDKWKRKKIKLAIENVNCVGGPDLLINHDIKIEIIDREGKATLGRGKEINILKSRIKFNNENFSKYLKSFIDKMPEISIETAKAVLFWRNHRLELCVFHSLPMYKVAETNIFILTTVSTETEDTATLSLLATPVGSSTSGSFRNSELSPTPGTASAASSGAASTTPFEARNLTETLAAASREATGER
jgi:hypothetical protein